MPKTRNVSRSQWDAADTKRKTRSAKENAGDCEKENKGRVTRASNRAGSGRPVLGASTTQTTTAKGKGKEKPPGKGSLTKVEKLPLQDITSRYLPAPESANRGHAQLGVDFDAAAQAGSIRVTATSLGTANKKLQISPSYHLHLLYLMFAEGSSLKSQSHRWNPESYNAWGEFDHVVQESDRSSRPAPTPRNSDPFGFFALEKKLEVEREHQVEIEAEDEEAGGEILVADTSSPRPVRRLPKHKYVIEAEVAHHQPSSDDDFSHLPPTPQKTVDRTRYSFTTREVDDEQLYSPGPSSCPSSPSPSKPRLSLTSSTKRKARTFDDEVDEVAAQSSPGSKQPRLEAGVEEEGNRRQLRSRIVKVEELETSTAVGEDKGKRKARPTKTVKKGLKKGKSKASSNVAPEDSDMDEWERERQVRLEYFRELEEYDFETENVYVV
ncbi:hypothetical protein FA13DRAFT_1785908 [Coprinellus micaceus]|uniref:Uncharacterized protein n=1 Tax=Coprinellus micaceus TaxID=71717 RepID=A0A4Y7TV85_COPMI|nr:hypothetical protein FA13DRAFT_1785908 [Coprinellus micaceus]